jgi:undecaprenyl diphosphate synthase
MSEQKDLPKHVAIILDGNRRWAKQRLLPSFEGHRRGYKTLTKIADEAFDMGIPYLSAYIFSTENWKRAKDEVDYLMDLALEIFTKDLKKFHKKGYRIRWFGVPDDLSEAHVRAIADSEETTKNNTGGQLCLCFNYGGKREIVEAVKKVIGDGVAAENIDETLLASYMQNADVPDVDLMIRTSGEQRISNFLLWRIAYAEMLFIKKHFPAFTPKDFRRAVNEYMGRDRRFGGNTK